MKSKIRDRMIIIPDCHTPFHNKPATKIVFDYIKQEKPQYVTLVGDVIDFYAVSRYSRDLKRRTQLQHELNEFHSFLDELQDASGNAQIIFIKGNHEARFDKYIREHAPEFEGLKGFSLPEVLQLNRRNIIWAPDGFTYGSCYLIHGDGLSGNKAGMTATKWLESLMRSVVVGHVHKLSIVNRRTAAGILFGMETGTLSNLDPEYGLTGFSDWQTGFSSLCRYNNGLIVPTIHRIINGSIY